MLGPQSDCDKRRQHQHTSVPRRPVARPGGLVVPRLVHPGKGQGLSQRRFNFGFAIRVVVYLILVAVLVIVIKNTLENNVA